MFSYVIVALNEESNIFDCIQSIKAFGGADIYLLDGGSIDKTVSIAQDLGCKTIILPGSSISIRRGYALDNIDCKYLFFVDADHRLSSEYAENELLKYFDKNEKLAGIQLRLDAHKSTKGYWAKGFSERLRMITATPGGRVVIGTPCIFRKKITQQIGYDKNLTGPSDDTLFCSKLIAAGYSLLAVKECAYELVRGTFRGTLKKAFWYGMGDAEYIEHDKKNRSRHLYHVYIRGIVIYPFRVLCKAFHLTPFFLIFGVVRGLGLLWGTFNRGDLSKTRS